MTRDQAILLLDLASQWLEGPGSTHPGATVARRAITSFLGSFASGALNTPEDEDELVRMIVFEGHLYLEPSASQKRQTKQLADAIDSAIIAARKGPTVTLSDVASQPQGDTLAR